MKKASIEFHYHWHIYLSIRSMLLPYRPYNAERDDHFLIYTITAKVERMEKEKIRHKSIFSMVENRNINFHFDNANSAVVLFYPWIMQSPNKKINHRCMNSRRKVSWKLQFSTYHQSNSKLALLPSFHPEISMHLPVGATSTRRPLPSHHGSPFLNESHQSKFYPMESWNPIFQFD